MNAIGPMFFAEEIGSPYMHDTTPRPPNSTVRYLTSVIGWTRLHSPEVNRQK